ncbi:MAG: hypothetical protein WAZ19_13640 [Anaerolineae bacterium]
MRALRAGPDHLLDPLPAAGQHPYLSWLTGAAAWCYWSATQYILGVRPEVDGLRNPDGV